MSATDDLIKQKEKELEDPKAKKVAEADASSKYSQEVRDVAEAIHKKMCRWNHTDGCGWFYESWANPTYSRTEYAKKAIAMLEVLPSASMCLKVVECL